MSAQRFSLALALLFLVVLVSSVPPVQGTTTVSYTISSFECVQVGTVSGGSWSSGANAAFRMVVASSNGATLYDEIKSDHAGVAPSSGNTFYTACNICRANEDLTVTFNLPDPLMYQGGSPLVRYFPSSTSQSGCPAGGFGVGGIADIPQVAAPILGPFVLIAGFIGIAFALKPFVRKPFVARPFVPRAVAVTPFVPRPFAPQPFVPQQINQNLPVLSTGITHTVPADAPMQALPSQYPEGYPYPPGTHSATTCRYCGMPTLCPFKDGWFCTNLQCPARNDHKGPGSGQTTAFVQKEWFQ